MASNHAFTLVELLVVIVVAAVLMAGFTGFYLSAQRGLKHHQVEIETSQALRTALDQMSRDIRSARKDLSGSALPIISQATTTLLEFTLDADDDRVVTSTDVAEHKGFQLVGTDLLKLDPTSPGDPWTGNVLAENVVLPNANAGLTFTYRNCSAAVFTPATQADRDLIATVDISLTLTRPVIGGLPLTRSETESVRLRNKHC